MKLDYDNTSNRPNVYRCARRLGEGKDPFLGAASEMINWMIEKLRPHLDCEVNVSDVISETFDFRNERAIGVAMEIKPKRNIQSVVLQRGDDLYDYTQEIARMMSRLLTPIGVKVTVGDNLSWRGEVAIGVERLEEEPDK